MNEHTIEYRGYEIDPIRDPEETGAWVICHIEEATCFRIFPPNLHAMCLDVEAYTLETAMAAVDIEIEHG